MLLYYTSRIKDNNIKNIINEATKKYIDNIKEKIYLKKEKNNIEFISEMNDNSDNSDNYEHNYGLIIFVSFISFLSGFSFGKKSIL
jgi:hypothetical protein